VYIKYVQEDAQIYLFLTTEFYLILTVHKLIFCDHRDSLKHSL